MARVQRLLHTAVSDRSRRGQDFDRQGGNAFDAAIRNDPRPVLLDEDDIGLDERRPTQDHVEGRRDDLTEVVGADVPVEDSHQLAHGPLMAKRGARHLDQLSVVELVALAVVRQGRVIAIRQGDLTHATTSRRRVRSTRSLINEQNTIHLSRQCRPTWWSPGAARILATGAPSGDKKQSRWQPLESLNTARSAREDRATKASWTAGRPRRQLLVRAGAAWPPCRPAWPRGRHRSGRACPGCGRPTSGSTGTGSRFP